MRVFIFKEIKPLTDSCHTSPYCAIVKSSGSYDSDSAIAYFCTMKVSILGEPYSFHYIAAMQYWNSEVECVSFHDFDSLIAAVQQGNTDGGVIAVENTIAGAIPGNYKRIAESGLFITGEIFVHLDMHLAAKSLVPIGSISTVTSHPMALKETADFFKPYPNIRLIPSVSTSTAAKTVSESEDPGLAAIANLAAIRFFNLQIIAKNIDNLPNNATHFLILSKESNNNDATTSKVKASLLLPEGAGLPVGTALLTRIIDNGASYVELPENESQHVNATIASILASTPGAKVLGIYPGGTTVSGS